MKQKSNQHKTGFPPLADTQSKLLILGSMPGEKSLSAREYYAHPRNLFWRFIAGITRQEIPQNYAEKKSLLSAHHIAVWDVCHACIREGSLDTAITDEIPNQLDQLLDEHPNIKTIAFNGQKSATLFHRYFRERSGYTYLTLPSSSPAHASMPLAKKMELWMGLEQFI
jgi:hypoxanthine-DNA glycosylase